MSAYDDPTPTDGAVTVLLERWAEGEEGVLDELFPLVHAELRRIAKRQRRHRGPSVTLDTTALVHEAYSRIAERDGQLYAHRRHFFAVAARAMRRILLDEAERQLRAKRGGSERPVAADPEQQQIERQAELMIAMDRALEELGQLQARARAVVDYRFFAGLTEDETAELLGVDRPTVRRDWAKARAWLAVELGLADLPAPG